MKQDGPATGRCELCRREVPAELITLHHFCPKRAAARLSSALLFANPATSSFTQRSRTSSWRSSIRRSKPCATHPSFSRSSSGFASRNPAGISAPCAPASIQIRADENSAHKKSRPGQGRLRMGLLKSPSGLWEEGALHMGEEWANCYCPARLTATTAERNAVL